jgi:hypothetical protein
MAADERSRIARSSRGRGRAVQGQPQEDPPGAVYITSVNEQLENEEERKKTLEGRGIGIITTSGALATLLFGVATFVQGFAALPHASAPPFDIEAPDQSFLVAALVLFVGAAVLGLLSNFPMGYRSISEKELVRQASASAWTKYDSTRDARELTNQKVDILFYARQANDRKALYLLVGFAFEVMAVVCVAAAVALIVEHHFWIWVVVLAVVSIIAFLIAATEAAAAIVEGLAEIRKRKEMMKTRKLERDAEPLISG